MNITKYYEDLSKFVRRIKVVDREGNELDLSAGAEKVIETMLRQNSQGKKVVFIGNGGSAAVASHMAIDFWKNGGIKAINFNNAAQLTCLSNDCGYENVFGRAVEMFADPGDVLVAISSSGESKNILNGVKAARIRGCYVVTLSGFSSDNPLSKMGDLNFYVPSNAYSHVEIIHHSICHYMLEIIMNSKEELR